MEDKEVEYLIDKKVAEAKLIVAEKRIDFLIWGFGILITLLGIVFGVILPLTSANKSAEEMRDAINNMKTEMRDVKDDFYKRRIEETTQQKETFSEQNNQINTLSLRSEKVLKEIKEEAQRVLGQSLSKPDLTTLFDNEEVNGKTVKVKFVENNAQFYLQLKNIGEVRAEKTSILLYSKSSMQDLYLDGWRLREVCEEEGYISSYEYREDLGNIDPQMGKTIFLSFGYPEKIKPRKEDLLLKIFSGLPKPKEIKFSVEPL